MARQKGNFTNNDQQVAILEWGNRAFVPALCCCCGESRHEMSLRQVHVTAWMGALVSNWSSLLSSSWSVLHSVKAFLKEVVAINWIILLAHEVNHVTASAQNVLRTNGGNQTVIDGFCSLPQTPQEVQFHQELLRRSDWEHLKRGWTWLTLLNESSATVLMNGCFFICIFCWHLRWVTRWGLLCRVSSPAGSTHLPSGQPALPHCHPAARFHVCSMSIPPLSLAGLGWKHDQFYQGGNQSEE